MRSDIDLTAVVATIHSLDLFQDKMEQQPELLAPPPPPPPPHKVCLVKRNNLPPFSEAAKALLSAPLPPQLVVDFKRKPIAFPFAHNNKKLKHQVEMISFLQSFKIQIKMMH